MPPRKPIRLPPPWKCSPKVARHNAHLHRIIANGLAPSGDKASLRLAASQAIASHRIHKV